MPLEKPGSSAEAAHQFLLGRINYERSPVMPYSARALHLDRMRLLLRELGDPQIQLFERGLPIAHVAGTKGKGSTSAMLASMLTAGGRRTGFYHSPHLNRIEERLLVDGQPCSADEFVELVETVRPIAEAMDRQTSGEAPLSPTFFELTTAIALLHFVQRNVQAAVIEVGLGGRLDSTNLCLPRVSVITSISFDHTQQLGNTLAKIAREKAGIIKPGVPVVCGVLDDEPRREIEQVASSVGVPLAQLGRDFGYTYQPAPSEEQGGARESYAAESCAVEAPTPVLGGRVDAWLRDPPRRFDRLHLSLLGRHQGANAAVAIAALAELERHGADCSERVIRQGLANVRWPARVEVIRRRPTVILDAAHNLASIEALIDTLRDCFAPRRRVLIFAASRDKDVRGMLELLVSRFDHVVLTKYLHNPRAVPPEELARMAATCGASATQPTPYTLCPDPSAAWSAARQLATEEDLICITGSFFLAAEMQDVLVAAASP